VKLLIVVVQDQDADHAVKALVEESFRVTRIATTGGFLQEGRTTLLIGVMEEQIETVIDILREHCHRRTHFRPLAINTAESLSFTTNSYVEVEIGGATIFILHVEHFEQV
jgi:uncharacterized protein YaaQ